MSTEGKKTAEVVKTEADKIWEEIRDLPIGVYALPDQKISQHVVMIPCPGNELLLKLSSTSVLPSLEETLGKKFAVELGNGYVIVRRNVSRDEAVKAALAKLSS